MTIENEVPPTTEYPTNGPWEVRLVIPCEEGETPIDAVDEFIESLNTFGIRNYLFRTIHGPTGDVFFVKEGIVYAEMDVSEWLMTDDDKEERARDLEEDEPGGTYGEGQEPTLAEDEDDDKDDD